MSKTLALIHTGLVLVESLSRICREIIPDINVINFVDESLLKEVIKCGKVTNNVTRRICRLFVSAEESGADVILNVCSSVGGIVATGQALINIPIIRIDEPMVEEAVESGYSIGVVATLETTLGPTTELIQTKASQSKKKIEIKNTICKGAFESLMSGKPEEHDRIVIAEVKRISRDVEVIVLAQGSMARLVPFLKEEVNIPILSSLRSGVEKVKEVINKVR